MAGCTVNGMPGDGTTRGTCPENQVCQANGKCKEKGRFPVMIPIFSMKIKIRKILNI